MTTFQATEHQHNRLNPLTGQWVLVCPSRLERPWAGQEEVPQINDIPEFDENNPLCPGTTRINGKVNPNYAATYVFENDFPALLETTPSPPSSDDPLFQMSAAKGTCRVMCFHPKTNKTLPVMTLDEIANIIDEWIKQFKELSPKYKWIQIFENKGASMGCSNPHPHCQIWACSFLPNEARIKNENLRLYYEKYGRPMLDDYIEKELCKRQRIVIENPDWLVVVPFWAAWPFETMVISRSKLKRMDDMNESQKENLATVIKELTTKYDNLFKCSMPYSMGFHGAPTGPSSSDEDVSHWTLHAIYYPPLLRSATIRKFMVGFELLGQVQRDLTAEQAAQRLREMDKNLHYSQMK